MSEHLPEHDVQPVEDVDDTGVAGDAGIRGDDPADMEAHGGNMATGESHP
jgi:hypothetical protein